MGSIRHKLALVAAAFTLLGACSQDPQALFESAKVKRAKGDRAGAIVQLKSAIQAEPRNPSMRLALAQLYLEVRDGATAEKELRTARELGAKDPRSIAADLAQALWLQGKATALLKDVPPPEGADVPSEIAIRIHSLRGRAQAQLGALSEARASLAQARKTAGSRPEPALALLEAEILAREGKASEALPIVDALLKALPRLYDALLLKANLVRTGGNIDQTIAAVTALLAVYPSDLNGLVARSSLLIMKSDWDAAEKDIALLRKVHKNDPFAYFQEGLLRFRKAQFRLALELFQTTLKRDSGFDLARLYLGMTHIALGEPLQAERILSVYVKEHPANRLARRMLAGALVDIGEAARALEVMAPVLAGKQPGTAFLDLAGEAYFQLGEHEKASELFEKVSERVGEGSIAAEKRAITRLSAGQLDAALEDFSRIAKARKGISNVDVALVLGYLRKDPARALTLIDELDKKIPGQPFLYNVKGIALLRQGKKDAAIAAFEEALKKQPSFLPAAANLFKLDIEQGKLEQGRQRFLSVIDADKKHTQAMLALAEVEQATGKRAEALALLRRAVAARPNEPEPRIRLITTLLASGDSEAAREAAQDFLNRDSRSPIAMDLMGKVQLSLGDHSSAVATYTRLVAEQPRSERTYLSLANAELAAGRSKDAEKTLRQLMELNMDNAEGRLAWVGLMVKQKRVEEARQTAESFKKSRPQLPGGWVLEADIHWATSKYTAAVGALRTALSRSPRDDIAIRLFEAQLKANDPKGALLELQQYVGRHPGSLQAQARLGEVLLRAGDYAGAARHFEAVSKSPSINPLILNALAWTYYKLNDPRALAAAEDAYQASPENPLIQDTLATILLRRGDAKRALALLERAVARLPKHPEIRFHYAVALEKTGDVKRARTELEQLLLAHKSFAGRDEAVALLRSMGS